MSNTEDIKNFVIEGYRNILKREPDPVGLEFHMQLIQADTISKEEFLDALRNSEEYKPRRQMIDRLVSGWERTERKTEIPFLIESLPNPPKKILDIGCCESGIAMELQKIGFEVFGIDLRPYKNPPFQFFQHDARNMYTFKDGTFDVCYAISTIEHVGLVNTPYHTDITLDDEGDKKVISEMVRVLKPGGIIILTIPYGKGDEKLTPWIRFYDKKRVDDVIPKNVIINRMIYKHRIAENNISKWIDVDESTASQGYSKWPRNTHPLIIDVLCILGHKCREDKNST